MGSFYDQMKLNLAISSFGGQYWSNCYYALDTDNIASDRPVLSSAAATAAASAPLLQPGEFRSHDACRDHVPGKPKLSHQSYNVFRLARSPKKALLHLSLFPLSDHNECLPPIAVFFKTIYMEPSQIDNSFCDRFL